MLINLLMENLSCSCAERLFKEKSYLPYLYNQIQLNEIPYTNTKCTANYFMQKPI